MINAINISKNHFHSNASLN